MLQFLKLTLGDIDSIKPYFSYSPSVICDNTVGGTFMWRDYFATEYAVYRGTLIFKVTVKYHGGITAFTLPLGKDREGSIQAVKEYCHNYGIPVIFCTATKDDIHFLSSFFKKVHIHKEANWSDYIYKAEDLILLPGRRYHGQKNHMNFFRKTYDYRFEEITAHNIGEVRDFYHALSSTPGKDNEFFIEERGKVFEVLDHYTVYGMPGGLLRADGQVAAFAVGEIAGRVLHVHIEKAGLRYRGAFQMICHEFAKRYASEGIDYINREEDMGDAGLRASKLSYHPCGIIDKYIVRVQ